MRRFPLLDSGNEDQTQTTPLFHLRARPRSWSTEGSQRRYEGASSLRNDFFLNKKESLWKTLEIKSMDDVME